MIAKILLFEDKLGITTGYENIWFNLLAANGLQLSQVLRRNSFKSLSRTTQMLIQKGNRKTPGFNPDLQAQHKISSWVKYQIQSVSPDIIITADPAMLFMLNPDWDQATIENLRGGVYRIMSIPTVVTLPISAWHTMKKEKDIARMNEGYTDEEEWEEEHGGDESDTELNQIWMEPVVIPYGKFVLNSDLQKVSRILKRMKK